MNKIVPPTKIAYTLPEVGMISFPLTDPKEMAWSRKCKNFELGVVSENGVPYGKYGRLVTILFCTEALKSKDGYWPIPSINDALDRIGLKGCSGKTGTAVHEQMIRLAGSKLSFTNTIQREDGKTTRRVFQMLVAAAYELNLLKETRSGQRLLESAHIRFSTEFGRYVHKHPEPVDLDVMLELDAIAQDMIVWASRKARTLKKPCILSKDDLVQQFYGDMKYPSMYYPRLIKNIAEIKRVYPKLDITENSKTGLIELRKSPPLVDEAKAKAWLRMDHYWIDELDEKGMVK
jgi:hypothetical protein